MKLPEDPRLPSRLDDLVRVLYGMLRDIAQSVNQLAEGRIYASYQAATAAPTAGEFNVGDFVKNSAPSELGAIGAKYVLLGWVCTANSPLTFKECRALTGN